MGKDLVCLFHCVYLIHTVGLRQIGGRQKFGERTPDVRDRKNGSSPALPLVDCVLGDVPCSTKSSALSSVNGESQPSVNDQEPCQV